MTDLMGESGARDGARTRDLRRDRPSGIVGESGDAPTQSRPIHSHNRPAVGTLKPADRLADLRERIKALEAEEESLRQGFIAGTLDQQGDEYIVAVESKVNERVDLKAMREHVAESIWRPFVVQKASVYVAVRRRDLEIREARPT